ncbi:MAG: hypothetical protein IPO09_09575 [Anaeromyxobacter sp.]|nr:hypothetical protein [Anaeromyxobacter sp.]MBL0278637.1 hypothetical protein [Anaeromyxobacter sp.]
MTRPTWRLHAARCTLALVLAAGCGREPTPCPSAEGAFACVAGATLAAPPVPTCEYPVTDLTGVVERTERALEIAGEVWGVVPSDYLRGWTISYCGGWFLCGSGDSACWTYGCARLDRAVIAAAVNPATRCLPGVLIHELGHLVVGDREHRDPRFALATSREAEPCEERRP